MANPNQGLAQNYYKSQTPYADDANDLLRFGRVRDIIGRAEVDIAAYYAQHHNLRGVKIGGVSLATKRQLELILAEGLEAAVAATVEARTATLHARPTSKYAAKYGSAPHQGLVRREFERIRRDTQEPSE